MYLMYLFKKHKEEDGMVNNKKNKNKEGGERRIIARELLQYFCSNHPTCHAIHLLRIKQEGRRREKIVRDQQTEKTGGR